MRKTVMIALIAMLMIGFTACKKDKKAPDSLSGTTWTYQGTDETEVLNFTDGKNVTITNTSSGSTVSMDATYSYDAPDVTINILGQSISGTVDGDKMTLSDGSDTKEYDKN